MSFFPDPLATRYVTLFSPPTPEADLERWSAMARFLVPDPGQCDPAARQLMEILGRSGDVSGMLERLEGQGTLQRLFSGMSPNLKRKFVETTLDWWAGVLRSQGGAGPHMCDGAADVLARICRMHGQPREIFRWVDDRGLFLPMLNGMSAPKRTSVLGEMSGLVGTDPEWAVQGEENEGRARVFLGELQQYWTTLPLSSRQRLPRNLIGALAQAVARRASDHPNGEKSILGIQQALQAAKYLVELSDTDYAMVLSRLLVSGGPTEDALLLKAVALRGSEESSARRGAGPSQATYQLLEFATAIRDRDPEELVHFTSCIDLTGRGGTKQRFTASCAPTSAIMGLAEMDPIFAFQMRCGGELGDLDRTTDAMSYMQQQALDAFNPTGMPVSRPRVAPDEIRDVASRALRARGFPSLWEAMSVEQRTAAGFADADDLALLDQGLQALAWTDPAMANKVRNDIANFLNHQETGMYPEGIVQMLETMVAPHIDAHVMMLEGDVQRILHASAWSVGRGIPSVFRVSWLTPNGGGHAMLFSDVRLTRSGVARRFLVSDPWSGNTAWIPEPLLIDGDFTLLDPSSPPARITHGWGMVPRE